MGYYALPRWGFDADLPDGFISSVPNLPGECANAVRLSELMSSEAGRAVWREYGDDIDVELPLVPPATDAAE